jgi:RNA polymerase sigma factor (sigma-70 family)
MIPATSFATDTHALGNAALDRPKPAGTAAGRRYLDKKSRPPRLSPERERDLVAAAHEGDLQARAQLVEEFMPLIASVARLYHGYQAVDRDELRQEGVVGLLRAVERYDPTQGTPFWGYAKFWVRQAMQQLVSELTRPVVLSDRALRHLARVKNAHRRALAESSREPSRDELAARAGLPAQQMDHLLAVDRSPRSTEEPVSTEIGAAATLGELLADPRAEAEYERVLSSLAAQELPTLLATLPERERMIVRARYGLDGQEENLRQIADRLGVSAERVRQLEQRALDQLADAWRSGVASTSSTAQAAA